MRPLLALTLAAAILATPAIAQTAAPGGSGLTPAAPVGAGAPAPGSVGSTVNGGLPEKTGSTTAVGQTKPPGGAVGDGLGTRPDLEEQSRKLNERIDKGICTGCK